jgi:hypothetical protein
LTIRPDRETRVIVCSLAICCICKDRKPEANFSKSQLRKPPDERAPDPNNAQQHAI